MSSLEQFSKRYSPLYASADSLLSTFTRVDLPMLGFIDEVLLYTDVDVWFRRDITMHNLGLQKLPTFYALGTETSGDVPKPTPQRPVTGNQGVMLLRVQALRSTYWQFLDATFGESSVNAGLHFQGFGPADQGAYNKYYSGLFEVYPWARFNWKPYWPYNPDVAIRDQSQIPGMNVSHVFTK